MGGFIRHKKGEQIKLGTIAIVIVLIVVLSQGGFLKNIFGAQSTQPPPQQQSQPQTGGNLGTVEVVGKCGQSVTLTADMVEKYAESTSMSAQNVTILVNGAEAGVRSDGGTLTVKEGDKITLFYAVDPAGNTYMASKAEGIVPNCAPAILTSDNAIFDPDDAHKLYKMNTQPTSTIINDDQSLNPSSAQAIGTGATRHLTVKLYPAFEQGYGHPQGGGTMSCRFTDSQIDQAGTTVSLLNTIQGMSGALPPAVYEPSSTVFATTATNQSTKHWKMPFVDGKTDTVVQLDLGIKGDDTNEPTSATNFSCVWHDVDIYKTDAGEYKLDVEDRDDNTNIGRATDFGINVLLS